MNSEMHENELLAQKVQELQSEIRRVKEFAIAGVALLSVLFLVVQIHDRRKLNTGQVVAKSVTLTDSDGNARVRLAMFPEGSGLEAYAASGERRVQLLASGEGATLNLNIPITAAQENASVNMLQNNVLLSSFRAGPNGGFLEMHSHAANGTAILALQGTTASLMLSGADENVPKIWLSADRTQACTALGGVAEPGARSALCLHSPGLPSLELADVVGNRAVVGIPHSPDLKNHDDSAA